jgi:DNA-binding response OmpR family regulator
MTYKTILLVDQDVDHLARWTAILRKEGYVVKSAANGRVGEIKAREYHPDLVISDVTLPYQNGFELCKALRRDASTASIRFAFMTSRAPGADSLYAMKVLGAMDYISKPAERKDVLRRIRLILGESVLVEDAADTSEASPDAAAANDGQPSD